MPATEFGRAIVRILAVSGSLQARSSNARVLEAARRQAPEGVQVVLSTSVGEMPHFNPDCEADGPMGGAVAEFRAELAAADAVLIATPEYAHALPGSLKNALDWIVGSGEFYGKRVAVISAAPSPDRGINAREMLERTLRAQGAVVVSSATIQVTHLESDGLGPATVAAVHAVLDSLIAR